MHHLHCRHPPCFHRWFLENFPDPTAWLDARCLFSRSAAVWSATGHIMGLGDRHGENVLVLEDTAEIMHVDFDCLFDKGVGLARPEIVPFRLTPNIVDALGITGCEGSFRLTMEVCMTVLRENKEMLLSVVEPFLRDPTVAWSRDGRAQKKEKSAAAGGASGKALCFEDHENKDAEDALQRITERLGGIYNIRHPRAQEIKEAYARRCASGPFSGIGSGREDALPLSVHGQVRRLIDEATSETNLAQMYIGM